MRHRKALLQHRGDLLIVETAVQAFLQNRLLAKVKSLPQINRFRILHRRLHWGARG
jgi:hypothetical protein